MKAYFAVLVLLLAVSAAAAEPAQQQSAMSQIKGFFSTVNPFVLIAAGVLLLIASGMAKLIGAILLVVGVIWAIISFL
jgi:hypothetical protein